MLTVRYTEWDGSQRVRLNADQVFEKFAEYLSYTDDLQQAFDWLLRHGMEVEGQMIMGLDEFLQQVRDQMRKRYQQYNLDDPFDSPRQRLRELLDLEREALREQAREDPSAREKLQQLDHLPRRLSDMLEALRGYDFVDAQARQEFENLLEEFENIRSLEEFKRKFEKLFQGPESLKYEEALRLMQDMERMHQLEEDLLSGNLQMVNIETLEQVLGTSAVHDFRWLRELRAMMADAGYLYSQAGRVTLSAKGIRKIGQLALREIYQGLLRDRAGNHQTDHRGVSESRPEATKPYAYGDFLHLDVVRTLKNALARHAGTPLEIRPEDFEVHEQYHSTTTSTVLLLDMSWSMSWEGRFAAAKKVALALESLIRARYPRDYFGIVGFYTRAKELKIKDLPEATWNMGDPFTNLQDGLRLASELIRRHPSTNQQMIIITDGQPTAYFSRGRLYCEWPLSFGGISLRAAQETLKEVERVTRRGIVINTFMLDDSPSLRAFVERMTRINKGRALFTRPDRLGQYLLVDYVARKRKRV